MNLLDAIAAAKSNNFASVLDKVGIPNVGKKTAGILAGRYNSLEQLIADSKDGLSAIEGVSERAAHSVAAYFQDEDLLRAVEEIGSAFVEQGLIDSPTDLYYVNRKYLLDPKTLRQKSADNLINAIEKSKSCPLTRVLVALGIAHVGSEVAALLARHFGSMDKLRQASREEMEGLNSIGPKIAEAVFDYFQNPSNIQVVEKLAAAGVNMTEDTSSCRLGNGAVLVRGSEVRGDRKAGELQPLGHPGQNQGTGWRRFGLGQQAHGLPRGR